MTSPSPAARVVLALVLVFRALVSPLLGLRAGGPVCRFTPSCTAYAEEALRRHGAARGSWLAVRRILRCHPWGGCGEDPVPAVRSSRTRFHRPGGHALAGQD